MRRILTITIPIVSMGLLSSCAGSISPTFLNPKSSVASQESDLYTVIFYMALAVFLLVEILLVYNIVRFRDRNHKPGEPRQIYGNNRLEFVWTAIPVILVLVLFTLTVRTITTVAAPAPGPSDVNLQVIGHQWWWEFDYPDLGIQTANELHVPVGANVQITLTSADVIHSFWVPQLSGKMDVIPGQENHLWFRATKVGEYYGHCAEFCGIDHANMRMKVVVQTPAEYAAWVTAQQQPAFQPKTEQQKKGYELITKGVCNTCHTLGDNKAKAPIGPNLTHLMSRSVFAGATYDLTEENLRRWLENPQAMKPGNDMKVIIQPDDIQAILSYLKETK